MESWFDIAKLLLEYIKALIWPLVVIFLVILFYRQLSALLGRIKSANLPGGVSLDFEKEIREARELSMKTKTPKPPKGSKKTPTIPLTEANSKMIKAGLQPSLSGLDLTRYRNLANEDPNWALAGLRMEIETMIKNLVSGFKLEFDERDSTGVLLKRLLSNRAITHDQFELIRKVLDLCNAAVHGIVVTKAEADAVIDISETLTKQYVSWLSWGFENKK